MLAEIYYLDTLHWKKDDWWADIFLGKVFLCLRISICFLLKRNTMDRWMGGVPFGPRHLAPPIGRQTTGCLAVWALDIWAPFPNSFLFFDLWRKNNEAGNSLNAVQREPVSTRVLNPNASEASYKPKQRIFFFRGNFGRRDFVGGILSGRRHW